MTESNNDTTRIEDECSINIQADPSCLQQFFNCTVHIHQHCGGCGNCDSNDSPCTCQTTDEPTECQHECTCGTESCDPKTDTPTPTPAPPISIELPIDASQRSYYVSIARDSKDRIICGGQNQQAGVIDRYSTDLSMVDRVQLTGFRPGQTLVCCDEQDRIYAVAASGGTTTPEDYLVRLGDDMQLQAQCSLHDNSAYTATAHTIHYVDNHILVAGQITLGADTPEQLYLLRLTTDFELVASCYFKVDSHPGQHSDIGLATASDGKIYLAHNASQVGIHIAQLDSNLNIEHETMLDTELLPHSATVASDGQLLICGKQFVARASADLSQVRYWAINPIIQPLEFRDIAQASDGSLYLGGVMQHSGANHFDGAIIKLNPAMQVLSGWQLHNPEDKTSLIEACTISNANQFWCAGWTDSRPVLMNESYLSQPDSNWDISSISTLSFSEMTPGTRAPNRIDIAEPPIQLMDSQWPWQHSLHPAENSN